MPANATATEQRRMTAEEFEALPDDGVERWLVNGVLREKANPIPFRKKPVTLRDRNHAKTESRIAHLLWEWLDRQPHPCGEVFSGEVGCRLLGDAACGIDVAYFSAETVAAQTADTTLMIGPPVVTVEILSPNDTQEEIDEKVETYLRAGVRHVWVVNTRRRTVTVYRPDAATALRNEADDLTAEPDLPGFRAAVSRMFGS